MSHHLGLPGKLNIRWIELQRVNQVLVTVQEAICLFRPPNGQTCYSGFTPLNLPAILEPYQLNRLSANSSGDQI